MLLALDPRSGVIFRDEVHRFDSKIAAAYRNNWDLRDIRIERSLEFAVAEPLFESKLMSLKAWRNSEVYNDFLKPNDAPYFLTWHLHRTAEKVVALSIESTRANGPFGSQDAERVAPLIPHLRRAIEIRDRIEAAHLRVETLQTVADYVDFGAFVLNARGQSIEANEIATAYLGAGRPLFRDVNGALQASGAAGIEIRHWWSHGGPSHSTSVDNALLHVTRPQSTPISLMLVSLKAVALSWIADAPRWLVLLFDPERRITASAEIVARDLSLSPREAEVAVRLAAGENLTTIAIRLGISLQTVRTHLKSVFAKTGTCSQAELLGAVLTGPARVKPNN